MVYYDDKCITQRNKFKGTYFTIVGDRNKYGCPHIINYIGDLSYDWDNAYRAAYARFTMYQGIDFQLLSCTHSSFVYIPHEPSYILALWYKDIDKIDNTLETFKKLFAKSIVYYKEHHSLPLYIPYRIDGIISESTWRTIILPLIVSIYGNDTNNNVTIIPSMVSVNRIRGR